MAAVLAAAFFCAVPVSAQTLPPAPFRPLPAGTTLDYGVFQCIIENSNGNASGMNTMYCQPSLSASSSASFISPNIASTGLSAEDQQALQSVWPLNARQTPQYSDIRFSGHEGGDFLFVRK